MKDYKEQIRKILALAESPNEHEARSALLKARALMAKYKLSEADFQDGREEEVVRKLTGVDYSVRRDPWAGQLADIIAGHHGCKAYQARAKKKQTAEIGFIGLSEDIDICIEIFVYAVDCVRSVTNKMRRTESVKTADGYGYGFAAGLMQAYDKQQAEEGWGLILVIPDAVKNEVDKMKKRSSDSYDNKLTQADGKAFIRGVHDGRKFEAQKRINKSEV